MCAMITEKRIHFLFNRWIFSTKTSETLTHRSLQNHCIVCTVLNYVPPDHLLHLFRVYLEYMSKPLTWNSFLPHPIISIHLLLLHFIQHNSDSKLSTQISNSIKWAIVPWHYMHCHSETATMKTNKQKQEKKKETSLCAWSNTLVDTSVHASFHRQQMKLRDKYMTLKSQHQDRARESHKSVMYSYVLWLRASTWFLVKNFVNVTHDARFLHLLSGKQNKRKRSGCVNAKTMSPHQLLPLFSISACRYEPAAFSSTKSCLIKVSQVGNSEPCLWLHPVTYTITGLLPVIKATLLFVGHFFHLLLLSLSLQSSGFPTFSHRSFSRFH